MELGSWEEVGVVIKKSGVRDYFQGCEMGRGKHQQQWRPLPNAGLKDEGKAGDQIQKSTIGVAFGR